MGEAVGDYFVTSQVLGFSNVTVVDIDAPDLSATPPTQTATVRVTLLLSDDNSDDKWWGAVNYSLIYLGQAPTN